MANIKLVKVRDPETGMYLNHEGKFVRDYAPADCIFRMRDTDGKVSLQHDFERTYLHACGSLKETLEPETGHFEQFHCPETFCTYARFSSAPHGAAAGADQQPEVNLLVEETDELPLEMMPIGNYRVLDDGQVAELKQLANGGGALGQFGRESSQGDEDMANLMRWVGDTPADQQSHLWISGKLKDGAEVQICKRGNASISVIRQKTLSAAGKEAYEQYKLDNPDEEWSVAVEAVVKYTSGNKTFWQNALFFGEQYLVGELIWQAARIVTKLLTKGLTKLFTEIAKRGVMRALTQAEARGLQAAMTQDRWYVKVVSYMGSGSRGARLLAGTFNFIVTAVIFIVIAYFVLPIIFKKQRASFYAYNFTRKQVRVSTAFLDNIPETIQENSAEAPYVLPAMTKAGDWITIDGLPIQADSNVVHAMAFDFENDSTFMQGFGALIMAQDVDNSDNALFASISIPWVADNAINLKVDKASADYKSLYKGMADQRQQQSYVLEGGDVDGQIGINALTGSDNRYTAQVNITKI
ncbi:hypothetical protein C882_4274 [Caenispirillum salinarum AK4]|uniref:Uncharacterized protein n=1 Tax=Caenispirillum salinarum AK4 TaxID=1238182 RepID=K9H066_9PROT|nr:hypothetical protein [Caenispirillum salinarum]EKV30937.1 hypothetical protein C882_4274 [Caenispirillum salinarum AK4]